MITKEFLDTVLATEGIIVLATYPHKDKRTGRNIFWHYAFTNTSEAAVFSNEKRMQKDVYFACHTMREMSERVTDDGRKWPYIKREAANALVARSFYCDLDVGESTTTAKKYATREAAVEGLQQSCKTVGLPRPMVVFSGAVGIHCYWLLEDNMPSVAWQALADKLKRLMIYHGLVFDHTVPADRARVLRATATFNWKDRDHPVKVTLGKAAARIANARMRELIETAAALLPDEQAHTVAMVSGGLPASSPPETPENMGQARAMLAAIDPDGARDEWRDVIWGAKALGWLCSGELARAWSQGELHGREAQKWDEGAFADVWDSFDPRRPGGIGVGTLVRIAREHGYSGPGFSEAGAGGERPAIVVEGGGIATSGDAAIAALVAADAPFYRHGGRLVTPIMEEVPAARGRTTYAARLVEVKRPGLIDKLARVANFQRFDARSSKYCSINPPKDVADNILCREGTSSFSAISGCVTAPTLRVDGSPLQIPGYDAASRLYLLLDPTLTLPEMPHAPTRADAEAALARLNALLDGFPFVQPLDRAVALSGLMMPVLRAGMAVGPMHLIRAHTAGTGKSYLVDLAVMIATGRPCPVSTTGQAPEELEKRLTAHVLAGTPNVSLDNVNGEVGGDVLCQMVERPVVSLRPLGVSEIREVECRATVFCTGNNTTVRGDMIRRTLTCNLDAGLERPELRAFGFDPHAGVLANRGRCIADVLAIAMAYQAAGSPAVCRPLGSYADYTAAVRGPLVWLGVMDPAASMEAARAEDPELVCMRELFSHWEAAPGLRLGEFYKVGQIEGASLSGSGSSLDDFRTFLIRQFGAAGAVSLIRLSKFLTRVKGRVVDGYRLEMKPDRNHGHLYALTRVGDG